MSAATNPSTRVSGIIANRRSRDNANPLESLDKKPKFSLPNIFLLYL
jgi:hypothetical protein